MSWSYAKPGLYVLSYPSVPADSTTIAWNDANLQYREWSTIPATYGVLVCTKDLSGVQRSMAATDNCAPGGDKVLKPFLVKTAVKLVAQPATISALAAGKNSVVVSWTASTKNVDATDLTDLSGYAVYRGTKANASDVVRLAPVPATTLSMTDSNLLPGDYVYSVVAINAAGNESDLANPVGVTVVAAVPPVTKPLPPGGLSVGANPAIAYTIIKSTDKLVFLPVGTIAPGTLCDQAQPVIDYFVVPRAAVTWSGNVQPPVVVGKCS